jgi:hypothetical protein
MNTELKITKGEWRVDDSGYLSKGGGICILNENECVAVVGDYNPHHPIKANAELIADAGNTIQSCGLLPSELKKQNDEMRELLEDGIELLNVKCHKGCEIKNWNDFENGNGQSVGMDIEKFIKRSKKLIESTNP